MPLVRFLPSGKTIEVPKGTTLFEAARRAGLPVAASCDAVLVCGKCNMRVVENETALSPKTHVEKKLLKKEGKPAGDRIACAARVQGDCAASASYW